MAKSYQVKLGDQAYSFYDQTTGFGITKGEVKELSAKQYASRKIRSAINSGFLQIVMEGEGANPYSDKVVSKLKTKLEAQYKRGMTMEKMLKSYSLHDLKALAEKGYELEVEDTDTAASLLEAILQEINPEE